MISLRPICLFVQRSVGTMKSLQLVLKGRNLVERIPQKIMTQNICGLRQDWKMRHKIKWIMTESMKKVDLSALIYIQSRSINGKDRQEGVQKLMTQQIWG